jgi:hypothetical protein
MAVSGSIDEYVSSMLPAGRRRVSIVGEVVVVAHAQPVDEPRQDDALHTRSFAPQQSLGHIRASPGVACPAPVIVGP